MTPTLIVVAAWAVWQLVFVIAGLTVARRGGIPGWRRYPRFVIGSEFLQVGGVVVAILAEGTLRVLMLIWLLLPWPFTGMAVFRAWQRRRVPHA